MITPVEKISSIIRTHQDGVFGQYLGCNAEYSACVMGDELYRVKRVMDVNSHIRFAIHNVTANTIAFTDEDDLDYCSDFQPVTPDLLKIWDELIVN